VFCANVGSTEVHIEYPSTNTVTPENYMTSGDCIAGAVYGGAENGHVMGDTKLKLVNGLVGHSIYGGGSGKGKFTTKLLMIGATVGSTNPNDSITRSIYSITAGKVFGNTEIEMTGGYVIRNVYGGGNMGSVGKGNYSGGSDDYSVIGYGELPPSDNQALWTTAYTEQNQTKDFPWHFLNSGKCKVTITGGTIGYVDPDNPSKSMYPLDAYSQPYDASLPYGNVFGGCRGVSAPNIGESPRYLYCPEAFMGFVNETDITIGTNGATTGPKILGSVYGGGQDGHVRRDSHVTVNSGEIGLAYDQETTAKTNVTKLKTADLDNLQWLARGNVYGAGSGIGNYEFDLNNDGDFNDVVNYDNPQTGRTTYGMKEKDYSTSAGSVTRFTQVDIIGGIIHRNVYGGGSFASVGAPKIPVNGIIPADPDRKGATDSKGVGYESLNLVNITGTVGTPDGYAPDTYSGDDSFKYNKVYGGEVYGASRGTDPDNTSLATSVWTEVNLLPGAHVLNNVFGGGDNGMVKQDAVVNVGLPVNVTPTSLSFNQKASAGETLTQTITVSFDDQWTWTATSDKDWLTVTPSGTGAGTITVTAADNLPEEVGDTVAERKATITIKGVFGQRTITVTQAGGN
jgi:hypothetical protein